MKSLLTLDRLEIGYAGRVLGSPLSAEIPTGARLGIIGANGSGKSTLVKTLLGLQLPRRGSYRWAAGTSFGYVPQENKLDPLFPLSVDDLLNMAEVTESTKDSVLNDMEIAPLRRRLVRDLSGGTRQRALIARALASRPDVLVLDEAYNFLDHAFRKKLRVLFERRRETEGFSLLTVDHDLNLLLRQLNEDRDWILLLGRTKNRIGRVADVVTEETLSETFEAEVHLHRENGETQIHIL